MKAELIDERGATMKGINSKTSKAFLYFTCASLSICAFSAKANQVNANDVVGSYAATADCFLASNAFGFEDLGEKEFDIHVYANDDTTYKVVEVIPDGVDIGVDLITVYRGVLVSPSNDPQQWFGLDFCQKSQNDLGWNGTSVNKIKKRDNGRVVIKGNTLLSGGDVLFVPGDQFIESCRFKAKHKNTAPPEEYKNLSCEPDNDDDSNS